RAVFAGQRGKADAHDVTSVKTNGRNEPRIVQRLVFQEKFHLRYVRKLESSVPSNLSARASIRRTRYDLIGARRQSNLGQVHVVCVDSVVLKCDPAFDTSGRYESNSDVFDILVSNVDWKPHPFRSLHGSCLRCVHVIRTGSDTSEFEIVRRLIDLVHTKK